MTRLSPTLGGRRNSSEAVVTDGCLPLYRWARLDGPVYRSGGKGVPLCLKVPCVVVHTVLVSRSPPDTPVSSFFLGPSVFKAGGGLPEPPQEPGLRYGRQVRPRLAPVPAQQEGRPAGLSPDPDRPQRGRVSKVKRESPRGPSDR